MLSSCFRIFRCNHRIRSFLVLRCSFIDDVSQFFSLLASLTDCYSATFVKARNEFRSAGINASIGRYAFGFTWGAWAAMFLAMIFLFLGSRSGSTDNVRARSSNRGTFFRRNKSTRSKRGSFIDNDSQRRVKDEYA